MLAFSDAHYASEAADRRLVTGDSVWRCRHDTQKCVMLSRDGSRVCSTLRRSEGVVVLEIGLAFHVASGRHVVYSGVRGQPGCFATCAKPDCHLQLEAHPCTTPFHSGTRKGRKEINIGCLDTVRI